MKALIVSPYFTNLGGGERYMLSIAVVLGKLGYQIDFGWDNLEEINHLAQKLSLKLYSPKLNLLIKSLYASRNPLAMYQATRDYDLVFYLSDGSIPMLGGRKNIVHMQVPFHGVNGKNFKNKLKFKSIDSVIVNSNFTKSVIDKEYGINSTVIFPPVDLGSVSKKKAKTILSVGRFEQSLNIKRQDVMIEAFREVSKNLGGWKLVLAGSSANDTWVNKLMTSAIDMPIEFAIDIDHSHLQKLYRESAIYWHAAGFEVNEEVHPEKVEHFGITTAEAISYGCIPLVVPYGGQKEIVKSSEYYWETMEELVAKTVKLAKASPQKRASSKIDVSDFSQDNFAIAVKGLING